jgi:hypothetical protein
MVLEERLGATSSKGAAANRPSLFETITQPESDYFAVPSVSSEKRQYIPIVIASKDEIMNNRIFSISSSDLALFAILESRVFTIWVQAVSSRLESRYCISSSVVYNNFPFPALEEKEKDSLVSLVQDVLSARKKFPEVPLGDLYDPILMPLELVKAHQKLDALVLKIFDMTQGASDAEVLEKLFANYAEQSQATLL